MMYEEIAAYFLQPLAEPIPEPVLPTSPARRLRDALEPIATQGWWSPGAGERMTRLGLPFLPGYVWGRAAALGVPASSVVVATFGVFEPVMLTAVYEAGVAAVSREDILALRSAGAAESLDLMVPAAEADAISGPLLRALEDLEGLGRPLFSALRELPMPPSAGGRLWRAAELVREHRGDGHLAVLAASGLGALEANLLTELWLGYGVGEYSGTRGFDADSLAAAVTRLTDRGWLDGAHITEEGRIARLRIEQATDTSQDALLEALRVQAVGPGVEELIAAASAVSEKLVSAGSFPPDPRKRGGG
jgi:hypothetical protein